LIYRGTMAVYNFFSSAKKKKKGTYNVISLFLFNTVKVRSAFLLSRDKTVYLRSDVSRVDMKDLRSLTVQELEDFFNSFDQIFSDVDGVLWNVLATIPGTQDGVRSLQKLGKNIVLVSNNTTKSLELYHHQLQSAGFDFAIDNIITPTLVMVSHLKKENFSGKIFVLGPTPLKQALRQAGFQVVDSKPVWIKETLQDFSRSVSVDEGSVGVVISDVDPNLNYVNLQKAATYLESPGVLFILGATDMKAPIGLGKVVVGPGYFHKILEEVSGRTGLRTAKPSLRLAQFVEEKFQVKDKSRVLFVGDS
jgi:HAD superfamily hydrolase (TIGR01450 family)